MGQVLIKMDTRLKQRNVYSCKVAKLINLDGNTLTQGFRSRWDILWDIRMGYHLMCRDRAILPASQHPDQDILRHLLSQMSGRGGMAAHPIS